MHERDGGLRALTAADWAVRVALVVVGLSACTALLDRVHIVVYPDAFPGRVYVDEDGRKYVYQKETIKSLSESAGVA